MGGVAVAEGGLSAADPFIDSAAEAVGEGVESLELFFFLTEAYCRSGAGTEAVKIKASDGVIPAGERSAGEVCAEEEFPIGANRVGGVVSVVPKEAGSADEGGDMGKGPPIEAVGEGFDFPCAAELSAAVRVDHFDIAGDEVLFVVAGGEGMEDIRTEEGVSAIQEEQVLPFCLASGLIHGGVDAAVRGGVEEVDFRLDCL